MLICYYCKKPLPDEKRERCPHCGNLWKYIDEDGYDGYYDDMEPSDYHKEDDLKAKKRITIITCTVGAVVLLFFFILALRALGGNEPDESDVVTTESGTAEESVSSEGESETTVPETTAPLSLPDTTVETPPEETTVETPLDEAAARESSIAQSLYDEWLASQSSVSDETATMEETETIPETEPETTAAPTAPQAAVSPTTAAPTTAASAPTTTAAKATTAAPTTAASTTVAPSTTIASDPSFSDKAVVSASEASLIAPPDAEIPTVPTSKAER